MRQGSCVLCTSRARSGLPTSLVTPFISELHENFAHHDTHHPTVQPSHLTTQHRTTPTLQHPTHHPTQHTTPNQTTQTLVFGVLFLLGISTSSMKHSPLTQQPQAQAITQCTSWRSGGSPSCLGGPSHGWVPVDTHSTPVLTSVRRLWVAHSPQAHHEPNAQTSDEPTTPKLFQLLLQN